MSLISLADRAGLPGIFGKKQPKVGIEPATVPSQPYSVQLQNWFSAKPYGFKHVDRNGNVSIFFLPISPQNLKIRTNFGTNVIPTLFGTVEEHSEVRYFDIVITGTTGITPKYVSEYQGEDPRAAAAASRSDGRAAFAVNPGIGAEGFFQKTLGVVNQVVNKATDLVDGTQKVNDTGVFLDQTGYAAFHNFYLFLMKYKRDAAGQNGQTGPRQQHPLVFFNYKDGNQYFVAIKDFVLTRSAENPMLYFYEIVMKGYNLGPVDTNLNIDDLQKRVASLGLTGVKSSTLLGEIKDLSNNAKQVFGALKGGINILGR